TFVQRILEDEPTKEVEELLDFSLSVGLPVFLQSAFYNPSSKQ
ncbi:glycerol dehydrogenase, partial [Marinilactibacillus piezotolerans]